jgi:hypothetical protein
LRLAIEGTTQDKQRQKPAAIQAAETPEVSATKAAETTDVDENSKSNGSSIQSRHAHIAIQLNDRLEGVPDDVEAGIINNRWGNNIRHHDNGRMS